MYNSLNYSGSSVLYRVLDLSKSPTVAGGHEAAAVGADHSQ